MYTSNTIVTLQYTKLFNWKTRCNVKIDSIKDFFFFFFFLINFNFFISEPLPTVRSSSGCFLFQ